MSNERPLTLNDPKLDADQPLHIRYFSGRETLSEPFEYTVLLHSPSDAVDFDALLGKEMSIGLSLPHEKKRYFHGYVSKLASEGTDGDYWVYRAVIRPHLWRLTRATNCRVFQNESVPSIVKMILDEHGITDVVTDYGAARVPYLPWEYCVQYRETDFAFVSRLLAHEGIHYYFKHEEKRHVLVMADQNLAHEPAEHYEKIVYSQTSNRHNQQHERIWEWRVQKRVLPGSCTVTDYDFKTPKADLSGTSGSEVMRSHDKAVDADYEVYDHLQTIVQQIGYSAQLSEDYARVRTEAIHTHYATITAQSSARGLCAGALFEVDDGPSPTKGQMYLVVSTSVSIDNGAITSEEGGASGGSAYVCNFEALDSKHPFRPTQGIPKPVIAGPQSATVVGKSGQDFSIDHHGRIRIKFHWDRLSKSDENSSCWVRVSQISAGASWGSMFVPHIGQEVLVGFMEGDPDRPIVIGRVYNGNNKPPLTLPDAGYKSIIRDKWSNEIAFDGTPGSEQLTMYSPSSSTCVNFSNEGVQEFTKANKASFSYDNESYSFGNQYTYTKGSTVSVARGFSGNVKAGVSADLTVGAELKISASAILDMRVGVSISLMKSANFSYGSSRDLRVVKGEYTQRSDEDMILDSEKSIYLTGGKNDNTMLASDDSALVLSYDEASNGARVAAYKKVQAKAIAFMAAGAAATASAGAGGTWQYLDAVDRKGEQLDEKDCLKTIREDVKTIKGFGLQDVGVCSSAFLAALAAVADGQKGLDIPAPKHPAPSAQVKLSRDSVVLFAGKNKEAELRLGPASGVSLQATKAVNLTSKDDAMSFKAKKSITLESKASVTINAVLRHKNMIVIK
ncbi:MAG: hypothetical protein RLZZ450_1290 [Pseudomonadota bacterium]|jgi:type VI secretion system secreted protein VgrG